MKKMSQAARRHSRAPVTVYGFLEDLRIPALRGKGGKVDGILIEFHASQGSRTNKHDTLPNCPQSPRTTQERESVINNLSCIVNF